eukprot:CAMPEP_0195116360 /NCGR_PEP_ID=MMETSP0448-20130528/111692_1 /TAXON_ID=66468 /ORGANISM="Heterocapsa triquestra, Strain CCMP 448" /LENGTH=174 /DNA_ID=CAMNT_0040153513 /DNA_START=22 /DNA_END=543 /DNA_ORIENTATION=+
MSSEEMINICGSWDEVRERFSFRCHRFTAEASREFIRHLIRNHQVMMFSKSYNSHGGRTQELLSSTLKSLREQRPADDRQCSKKLDVHVLDLDTIVVDRRDGLLYGECATVPGASGVCVQLELMRMTKMMTVPQVFINGDFIGGWNHVEELQQNGSLTNLLTLAMARHRGGSSE